MSKITITEAEAIDLHHSKKGDVVGKFTAVDKGEWRDEGRFTVVDKGEWQDEGKYQYLPIIFSHETESFTRHYRMFVTRSGSYFTDYEYEYDTECLQVKKVIKTIEDWDIV